MMLISLFRMVQAHKSVCRKLDGGFSFCSMQNGNRAITKSRANTVYINLLITDEPGKQVSSAIKIKNVSRSHVAFKVSSVGNGPQLPGLSLDNVQEGFLVGN
jgi:hypothetical protein